MRIVCEFPVEWPEEGPLQLNTQLEIKGEIAVSPESARRRANGYLGLNVAMAIQACDPVLVWGEPPVWRLQINLYLRGLGNVANLGTLEVTATTREVVPLSKEEIANIQTRANAIALSLAPKAASTS